MNKYDLPSGPTEEVDIGIRPVPIGFVFSDEAKIKTQQSFQKIWKFSKDLIIGAYHYLRMTWS